MIVIYPSSDVPSCSSYPVFFSGNIFSSLEGLEVIWELKTVEGVGSVSAQSVLRYPHITYSHLSIFPYFRESWKTQITNLVLE